MKFYWWGLFYLVTDDNADSSIELKTAMMDNLVLQLSGESNRSLSPNSGVSYPMIPLLSTPAEIKSQSVNTFSGCHNYDGEPSGSLSSLLCG